MKGGAMFLLLTLFLFFPASAYDQHSTHPSLTYEMAQFFNVKNLNLNYYLLPNEVAWLKQGSVEEDEPARWINHFYDPVHNAGWSGKHLGDLSTEEAYNLGGDMAPRHSIASIDWVTNQNYQAAYGRQYGNQTWQKAIKSYIDGDKKSAFIALGHVLHLVEDATVPDHVRDDSHPGIEGDPGSPYEVYSKVQTDAGELRTAEDLLKMNKEFKQLQSVNQAIKDVAVYTNKNFFSEDTISNSDFSEPFNSSKEISYFINGKQINFLVKNGNKIARIAKQDVVSGERVFTIDDTINIMPSYRNHLFPEAVLTGASVINLFFQEVEKYKQNPNLLEPIVSDSNDSLLKALAQFPKRTVVKACGWISESLCKDAHNNLVGAVVVAKSVVQTAASAATSFVTSLFKTNKAEENSQHVLAVNSTSISIFPVVPSTTTIKQNIVAKPVIKNTQPKLADKIIIASSTREPPVLGIKIINPVSKENTPSIVLAKPKEIVYGGGVQGSYVPDNKIVLVPDQPTSSTISTSTPEAAASSTPPQIVPSTTPSIPDTVAPTVPIVHTNNLSGVSSTNIVVHIASEDALSGVGSFDLQYSSNTIDWFDLVITGVPINSQVDTASFEYIFTGVRGQVYAFKARATDVAGNISEWSQATQPVFTNWSGEVVINEIAWAGTSSDAPTQEWFELYNNTNQNIDLSNWDILVSGRQISFSKINNTIINAKGYYVFERSSDNTLVEIEADAVYGLSGGFNNSGEKIELVKPDGEKADEVNADRGWFAGGGAQYKSMERVNSTVNGSQASNWQSNQGLRETGRTFNGGPVYGSPKRSNFGFINLIYDQADTVRTLTKANNPYILQHYIIPAGKKLIIEPGVIIKSYFSESRIEIFGTLTAWGDASEKIIFTSGRDTGVDTNMIGSWSGSVASSQDWQGLWFKPGSEGVLSNTYFNFAGKGFAVLPFSLPFPQAIRIDGAEVAILDSVFSDNGPTTLFSKDASTTILRSQFSAGDRALQSENSALYISDSMFSNYANISGPLFIKDKWPVLQNISYQQNTLNMPYLESVSIVDQTAVMVESENYLVHVLKVSSTGALYIQPGVSLYIPIYGIIEVGGSLQALGTAQKPISFLPYPASVNWGNIRFNKSTSTLSFVHLKQGNRLNGRPESLNGMILANDSYLTINNSSLWDSEANSMQSANSVVTITNSTIGATLKQNNSRGLKVFGGSLQLDMVDFSNLTIGVESSSSGLSALAVDIKNMSSSSFSNVDYFWQPFNLWSFSLPSLETF